MVSNVPEVCFGLQTPTVSAENGNQNQFRLHSMIGLNDGFTELDF